MESSGDITSLLREIRQISLEIKTNTSVYAAMGEAKMLYYTYMQELHETNAKH